MRHNLFTAQEMKLISSSEWWEIEEKTGNDWTPLAFAEGVSVDEINAERAKAKVFGFTDLFFIMGEKGYMLEHVPIGPDGQTKHDPRVLKKEGEDYVYSEDGTTKFRLFLKEQEQELMSREGISGELPHHLSFFLREAPGMLESERSTSSEGINNA